ncbi:hypothetical protein F4778DRAFT_784662 [Xylariomycetidae sp. FL2044]|nr:hypothetical protein F4778DRAFT_784662 [Xylariomycetidae sp. FL2044]
MPPPPPPPATPTPRRFLVPKRSQPRAETPKSFQAGTQQFQATPRFSLHSTPRPSQSSSSAPGAPFRLRNTDPINDIIDSSPPFATQKASDQQQHHQSIEVDIVQESSPIAASDRHCEDDDDGYDRGFGSRSAKRRRVSVSSIGIEESSPQSDIVPPDPQRQDDVDNFDIQSSLPDPLSPDDHVMGDGGVDEDDDDDATPVKPSRDSNQLVQQQQQQQQQQPTFHKAPRFKPTELADPSTRGEPLPDVFSPQGHHRKGAKYVPAGLAAEVRDWLVGIESGSGSARHDGVRIVVDEVRAAPGMMLVSGRQMLDDDDGEDEGHAARPARVILAGPGRMAGLAAGRRAEVIPGSVVGVGRLSWEVGLESLGRWGVVCEWEVLK